MEYSRLFLLADSLVVMFLFHVFSSVICFATRNAKAALTDLIFRVGFFCEVSWKIRLVKRGDGDAGIGT
jgi:hypothetical protein